MAVDQRTITLPAGYTIRHPTREDLPAITELTRIADVRDFGGTDFTLAEFEMEWAMPRFQPQTDAWIVEHDGVIVASTHVTQRPKLPPEGGGWVHPDHRGRGLGTLLVELAEQRSREIVFAPGTDAAMAADQFTNRKTPGAAELMTAHGYRMIRNFWRMSITLGDDAPPAAAWPEGIELRPMRVGVDDETVYTTMTTAFRDHWRSSPLPFPEWRELRMNNRHFDPTLWLLAWQGDAIVGASLNGLEDGQAWVHTLGVRREARGRGLARALLLEGFRRFHERGIREVLLGVDAENATGATRLYESVGMAVDREWDMWEKELEP